MFGTLFSAIGKVFKPVTNAITRVGSAIFGVGSAVSTAGAATGATSMAQGGLNSFLGGGTLGNVLGGAIRQAGFGALLGAGAGALTGLGAGKGALAGGLAGAVTGGLSGLSQTGATAASTPTGMAPTGTTQPISRPRGLGTAALTSPAATQPSTVVTPQAPPRRGLGTMFTNLFQGEQGGAILKGVGEGLLTGLALREQEAARDRRDQQVRDSYSVSPDVLHKPLTQRGNSHSEPSSRYVRFNPQSGLIE